MKNNKINNKILINRIFNGSYNKDNIGHEFINLLNPDNNQERYLYICPYGYFSNKEYINPRYIIFCKTINSTKLKILGISTKHELQHEIYHIGKDNKEDIKKKYNEQCKTKISYLDVELKEYFENQDNTLLFTFKSSEFYKPKDNYNIYLTTLEIDNDEKNIFIKIDNRKQLTSYKQYNYIDNKQLAETLQQNIQTYFQKDYSNSENLKNEDGTYKLQYKKSFLDIIKKTDDENIFSNWLASILNSNEQLCTDFIKKLLEHYNKCFKKNLSLGEKDNLREVIREHTTSKKSIKSGNNTKEEVSTQSDNSTEEEISTETEKQKNNVKRIDLWIETNDYIIYIENKIKSGINGYTEKKHDWQDNEIKSQLSYYYQYALDYNCEKTIIPIILAPDYSEIFKDEILNGFENGKAYCKIKYSDLFNFFNNYKIQNQLLPEIFFDEFMKAIDRHTKSEPLSVYEETYQKIIDFAKTFNKSKKL